MEFIRNLKRRAGRIIHHTASKVRRSMWGTSDKTVTRTYIDPVTRTVHSVLFNQEYMRNVFKYLDLPGKNSFSYVCHDWNIFAHEYYKSEKTYNCDVIYLYWDLKGLLEDLKARPLTKRLTFDRKAYRDKDVKVIIDCIINNIHQLQHVILTSPEPDDIIALLNRYDTLETIHITCTDSALLKSIQAFKNREHLETLQLNIVQSNSIIVDHIFEAIGSGLKYVQRLHIDVKTRNREQVYLMPNHLQAILLSGAEHLTELHADYNDYITPELTTCKKVENVNVNVNNIKKSFDFSLLQNLKKLYIGLHGSCLNAAVLDTFQKSFKKGELTKLQSLAVYSDDKKVEIGILRAVAHVPGLKSLRLVNIDSNTLDNDLMLLPRFRSLSYLEIRGSNCISNDSVLHIAQLVDLEALILHPCSLSNKGLVYLRPCRKLKSLTFKGCTFTESAVLNFITALPNLKHITIEKCGIDVSALLRIRNMIDPNKTIVI